MKQLISEGDERKSGFTLIELLIVIAIIAILALIAIPNFLDAQTRSKVARAQADMRTIATGLEAYYVDYNSYPYRYATKNDGTPKTHHYDNFEGPIGGVAAAIALAQPIAYSANSQGSLNDPFAAAGMGALGTKYEYVNFLGAQRELALFQEWKDNGGATNFGSAPPMVRFHASDAPYVCANWGIISRGPDRTYADPCTGADPGKTHNVTNVLDAHYGWMRDGHTALYDPSNGTMSSGNIWRLSNTPR